MGGGTWSASTHRARSAASGGDPFAYSASAKRSGHLAAHPTLDPMNMGIRESRDSAEHPESNAIIVSLDVTGSMGAVVRGVHADLPQLHELLLGYNYIPHPQILFGAVGDATTDQVPLQVGQFESDNRMDQHLENMVLEGGGGGQKTESYELMLYIAAKHTSIDCWEKRARKGYLFMIGDEMAYKNVKKTEVSGIMGGGLQANLPLEEVIRMVKERYHLYYIIPAGASHGGDEEVYDFWRQYIGAQQVLRLADPNDTSELIALTIGLNEGTIDVNEGVEHLRKTGASAKTVADVTSALQALPATTTGGLVKGTANALGKLLGGGGDKGTTRL